MLDWLSTRGRNHTPHCDLFCNWVQFFLLGSFFFFFCNLARTHFTGKFRRSLMCRAGLLGRNLPLPSCIESLGSVYCVMDQPNQVWSWDRAGHTAPGAERTLRCSRPSRVTPSDSRWFSSVRKVLLQ